MGINKKPIPKYKNEDVVLFISNNSCTLGIIQRFPIRWEIIEEDYSYVILNIEIDRYCQIFEKNIVKNEITELLYA